MAIGGSSLADVTVSFTGSTVWLLVGAFVVTAGAKRSGVAERPAFAIGPGVEENLNTGIVGWISSIHRPMALSDAIAECAKHVEDANDQVIRLVLVGQAMSTTAA